MSAGSSAQRSVLTERGLYSRNERSTANQLQPSDHNRKEQGAASPLPSSYNPVIITERSKGRPLPWSFPLWSQRSFRIAKTCRGDHGVSVPKSYGMRGPQLQMTRRSPLRAHSLAGAAPLVWSPGLA